MKRFCVLFVLICLMFPTAVSAKAIRMDKKTMSNSHFGKITVDGTKNDPMKAHGSSRGKKFNLSTWGLDGSLEYVHGMYYTARVTKTGTYSSADSEKSKVKVKKGTQVLVTFIKSRKGNSVCRLKSGRTVKIPTQKLRFNEYIYNSSSAYTDYQIEDFVRQKHITSKTKYMFFVSKFNQHGWILEKKGGSWVCKYHLKVGTGAYTNGGRPNDVYGVNSCSINTHYINKRGFGQGISYASKNGGNQIHKSGTVGHPVTHGCIGIKSRDYKFIYWYLPYGTRVVLY